MSKIDILLQTDPLLQAEKLFNKDYKDFNEEEMKASMFGFMLNNKIKEEVLKEVNDTYFSMKWKDFINLIEKNGFDLQNTWEYKIDNVNTAVVYEKDGIVLIATSFGESVNGGSIYAEVEVKEGKSLFDIPNCSFGYYNLEENKAYLHYDIREGLFNFINNIEKIGTILPRMESTRNQLWMATAEDERKIGNRYDKYDKVREKRILESNEKLKEVLSAYIKEPQVVRQNTYNNLDIHTINIVGNTSKIESEAICNCPNLTKINISSNVKVPVDMVNNCPNLQTIIVNGKTIFEKSNLDQNIDTLDNIINKLTDKERNISYDNSDHIR